MVIVRTGHWAPAPMQSAFQGAFPHRNPHRHHSGPEPTLVRMPRPAGRVTRNKSGTVYFHLLESPGKMTNTSTSDRFPLQPTGEIQPKQHILKQMEVSHTDCTEVMLCVADCLSACLANTYRRHAFPFSGTGTPPVLDKLSFGFRWRWEEVNSLMFPGNRVSCVRLDVLGVNIWSNLCLSVWCICAISYLSIYLCVVCNVRVACVCVCMSVRAGG